MALMRNIGTLSVATQQLDGGGAGDIHQSRLDPNLNPGDTYNISSYGDSGSPIAYQVDPIRLPIDGGGTGGPIVQLLDTVPDPPPPPIVNTAIVVNNAAKKVDVLGVVTLGTLYAAMLYPQKKKTLAFIPRLGFAGGLVVLYFILKNSAGLPDQGGR